MLANYHFFLIFFIYWIVMNVLSFFLMGLDKRRAKKGKWRIPEKTLFGTSLLGGSIGSIAGMRFFRHKTKHSTFVIGMPCILILQIVLLFFFMKHF